VGSGTAPGTDLKLPPRTTTPPTKTQAALDADHLKKLSELKFPDFAPNKQVLNDHLMVVIHKTTAGKPTLAAGVTVEPCGQPTPCVPMDLDKWNASPTIKELLPTDLQTHPDTHFETGKTDVNGEPMIFTYQNGMNFSTDEAGTHGRYSNAYVLYYNDGINYIRVVAEYKDLPPKTLAELVKLASKEDLEKIAKAFMDAYTHAW
jgi:hypothetical protein